MTTSNQGSLWTLTDFIREYGAEDLRIDAVHLQQVLYAPSRMSHKIVVNNQNIVDKYLNELTENKQIVDFNTKEYFKYRYNPKLLSFDVYGTTELWFLILMANELYSVSEFNLRKVVMYDASIIAKINRMLEMDNEFLEINSMNVKRELE